MYWVSNACADHLDFGKHKIVQDGTYPPLFQIGVQLLSHLGAGDYVAMRKTAAPGILASYFGGHTIIVHELLWSYFLDEAYFLELMWF